MYHRHVLSSALLASLLTACQSASAPVAAPGTSSMTLPPVITPAAALTMPSQAPTATPVAAATSGVQIAGLATLPSGPLAGAELHVYALGKQTLLASGTTDANGKFAVALDVPVGSVLEVAAHKGGKTYLTLGAATPRAATYRVSDAGSQLQLTLGTTLAYAMLAAQLAIAGPTTTGPNGTVLSAQVNALVASFQAFANTAAPAAAADPSLVDQVLTTLSETGGNATQFTQSLLNKNPGLQSALTAQAASIELTIQAAVDAGGTRPTPTTATTSHSASAGGGSDSGPVVVAAPLPGAIAVAGRLAEPSYKVPDTLGTQLLVVTATIGLYAAVNPTTGTVYLVNDDNTIQRIARDGTVLGTAFTLPTVAHVSGQGLIDDVVVTPAGLVYVASKAQGKLYKLDASGTLLATIDYNGIQQGPTRLAVDGDSAIWVQCEVDSKLHRLNQTTDVDTGFELAVYPHATFFDPTSSITWFMETDLVHQGFWKTTYDTGTHAFAKTGPLGTIPAHSGDSFAIQPTTEKLYVGSHQASGPGALSVFNQDGSAATLPTMPLDVTFNPVDIRVDPLGNIWVVNNVAQDNIVVLNPDGTYRKTLAVGRASRVGFDGNGDAWLDNTFNLAKYSH